METEKVKLRFYIGSNPQPVDVECSVDSAKSLLSFLARTNFCKIVETSGRDRASVGISLGALREEWVKAKQVTVEDIIKFIESKPEFAHSTKDVMVQFIGKPISAYKGEERSIYDIIIKKHEKARKFIEQKYGGKFHVHRIPERTENGGNRPYNYFIFRKLGSEG